MSTFSDFYLKEEYCRISSCVDPLESISGVIDWTSFRPLLSDLYSNSSDVGGRPNYDPVLMIKLLVLREWYGLSDMQLEREAYDRISFHNFLGYPSKIPDHGTIWLFRDRLAKTGKDTVIWTELQNQLNQKGLSVKRGVMQDATFITSDPGHAKADKPRGDEAKTRRSRDGKWMKKGNKSFFGFKGHILMDKEHQLIHKVVTTPANVADCKVDLSEKGQTVYRDKGYFGVKPNASMDKTMHRATRNHPLSIKEERRNRAISKTRSLVERPFAVIKTVFRSGHVRLTTTERVRVSFMFKCFDYNLRQLLTIQKKQDEASAERQLSF